MNDAFLKVYVKIQAIKHAILGNEQGQDLIEYALVVALIALAATAGMSTLAGKISSAFTGMGTKLDTYIQ